MSRPRSSPWIRRAGFVCTALTVALVTAEISLRLFFPRFDNPAGSASSPNAARYGWAPFPRDRILFVNPDTGERSVFETNSRGWKDVEHAFEKPGGVFRILFLGDSNTYGVAPLEAVYPRQVERLLAERGAGDLEVISIGAGSWGTDQELEALLREGVRYAPDIVILQFSANDLRDNLQPAPGTRWSDPNGRYLFKPFRYALSEGELTRIDLRGGDSGDRLPLRLRVKRFLRRSDLLYRVNLARWRVQGVEPWWIRFPLDPAEEGFPFRAAGGERTRDWELMEALILEFQEVCAEHGAAFAIFSEAGDAGAREWELAWNRIETGGGSDFVLQDGEKTEVDLKRPLIEIEKICVRHGIALIAPRRVYKRYRNNNHATPEGNRRMAEDIVDFLASWEVFQSRAAGR